MTNLKVIFTSAILKMAKDMERVLIIIMMEMFLKGNARMVLRHGKGTYFALRDDKFKGDIFIGQYKNGKKDGYGTYIQNGNKYEGNYKNNELHGFGIYNYNSFEYRGEYKNGKRHSEGILKWPSGKIQRAFGKNGKFLNSKNLKINQIHRLL